MEELDKVVEKLEIKPLRDDNGRLLPNQVSLNPKGRPKGKTLKEYMAEKFRTMTDEQKEEWLVDVAKVEKWRMAEGNPQQDSKVEADINVIDPERKAVLEKALDDIL